MDELLNQICRIYNTPSAPDGFGKQTFGGYTDTPCRFVRTHKASMNERGLDFIQTAKFQIAGAAPTFGTKIEFENKFYKVERVKEWRGEDGELFGALVYCSNWPV